MKNFRTNGAVGALLDEYERMLAELLALLDTVSPAELTATADSDTSDPDCRSIQTVLTHVVRSGYGYAICIRNHQGENLPLRNRTTLASVSEYQAALRAMFIYNEQVFSDYPDMPLETYASADKILVSWGQRYDVEQLMEHAILHIMRHRRQIERFLLKLRA